MTSQLLRAECGVEVFCPFVRFERARRSGKLWVTEAMFPGYVFANFDYMAQHRRIQATNGVAAIVSFGSVPAVVQRDLIEELRQSVRDAETIVIPTQIEVGEEIHVVEGPFQGIRAVVSRVMPARERVAVLLEILGMEREVEVDIRAVLPDVAHPMAKGARR